MTYSLRVAGRLLIDHACSPLARRRQGWSRPAAMAPARRPLFRAITGDLATESGAAFPFARRGHPAFGQGCAGAPAPEGPADRTMRCWPPTASGFSLMQEAETANDAHRIAENPDPAGRYRRPIRPKGPGPPNHPCRPRLRPSRLRSGRPFVLFRRLAHAPWRWRRSLFGAPIYAAR